MLHVQYISKLSYQKCPHVRNMKYALPTSCQIVESSKVKGERDLREKQEKVQIEIEKCHRRVEEFAEYSDLSLMQQYCKDITM